MGKCVFLVRNVGVDKYGGGEFYQLELARVLKHHGFLPIIITNSETLLKKSRDEGFSTLVPPYLYSQNWSGLRNVLLPIYCIFQLRLRKWYIKMIKQYRPIVVNIQSRDDMIAGTLAAKKMNTNVIWTDHADFLNWVLWNVNKPLKNVIGKIIVKLSSKTEKVIFISKTIKAETEKMIFPSTIKNAIVINNGVKDEFEKYRTIHAEPMSFAYVGRVSVEKGIEELLQASVILHDKYPEAVIHVYGEKEGNWNNRRKNSNVIFHGFTNEPLRILAEVETFLLPSHMEGLSLSLLDAAMMSKTIIASNVGGNPEIVRNKRTGLLIPAKDASSLADAMIWVIEHKKKGAEMAKEVRKLYEKDYNFDTVFENEMLLLYNKSREKK